MENLLRGLKQFANTFYAKQRKLFEGLSDKQSPTACFVCCSDSRVSPTTITQSSPGEIFVMRNVGNIVPPYDAPPGGEAASLEFALVKLKVKDLIVCGHSDCGAVRGLLGDPAQLAHSLPLVARWLAHAQTARRIVDQYPALGDAARLRVATKINVLAQLTNLYTHPIVAQRCEAGDLNLHGWYYDIGAGQVLTFDLAACDFIPSGDVASPLHAPPRDLRAIINHELEPYIPPPPRGRAAPLASADAPPSGGA
jgi:carbonic anhydrase